MKTLKEKKQKIKNGKAKAKQEFDPKFKVTDGFNGNPFSCRSCKCHP